MPFRLLPSIMTLIAKRQLALMPIKEPLPNRAIANWVIAYMAIATVYTNRNRIPAIALTRNADEIYND